MGKVALNPGYNCWKRLYDDCQRYVAEKLRVADAVIGQLEKCFLGLAKQIEVIDVSTLRAPVPSRLASVCDHGSSRAA